MRNFKIILALLCIIPFKLFADDAPAKPVATIIPAQTANAPATATSLTPLPQKQVILFVWDGLRPDSVTERRTPNLYALLKKGVRFQDNHSTYPTFTMMNAASFATGDFADKTGFFGNVLWRPSSAGVDYHGSQIDFQQPVFTEDYKVLQDLDQDHLFLVNTLLELAHKNGLKTAVVGKSGPAFIQDYKSQGIIVDEKHVYPLAFAKQLQQAGYPLPIFSPLAYAKGELQLSPDNGDPTAAGILHTMEDGVTCNPTDRSGSPYANANEYMMKIYLNEILAKERPQLSIIWMRDPDTTEHCYAPGTPDYRAALISNDKMLGELDKKLKELKLDRTTDIVVVSDHSHSHVSAPVDEFPLRTIHEGAVGTKDIDAYSVSGEVRVADLLTRAGFHAYDGEGCRFDPVLSGIKADGEPLYATLTDKDGSVCGKAGQEYTTPAYRVPTQDKLPPDAVIVAANGGSDYFYLPSHNPQLLQKLVTYLQSHTEFGAIFTNDRYGDIAGTLPLSKVKIENASRSPDVIASFNYDDKVVVNGLPGIEFSDNINARGMHGSFSPIDVHNFLFVMGPDFRRDFRDKLPTGNVDVAPTVSHILNLDLKFDDGRVLFEALKNGTIKGYTVKKVMVKSTQPAQNLTIVDILNQPLAASNYSIDLQTKTLDYNNHLYTYFDFAKAIRDQNKTTTEVKQTESKETNS